MKLFVLFACAGFIAPANDDISGIRSLYRSAINSSSKADDLVKTAEKKRYVDGVTRAYYGTGIALQAKHSINPFTKLSKAKTAAYELNVAVNMKPGNLEVCFLRFSFESNLPDVVNVTKHLSADKAVILSKLDKKNAVWDIIKPFLLSSTLLTEAEKKKVRDL